MNISYFLDACSIIAFFRNEKGADEVEKILRDPQASRMIHSINLLEVYYDAYRIEGKSKADEFLETVKQLPLQIINSISENTFLEAGKLKATYRISLADAIAVAETKIHDATLLTADHHEFEELEKKGEIKISWIR